MEPTEAAFTSNDLSRLLSGLSKTRLELRINRNRSSVLSKKRLGHKHWALSIHERFCSAPVEVLHAVALWLSGHEDRKSGTLIRRFINEEMGDKPRQILKPLNLVTEGEYFDLLDIYHEVNRRYFDNTMDCWIGWYSHGRRGRCQVTLGKYCAERELIQINSLLDSPRTPREYIAFVVYHEMVHHVVPPLIDSAGRKRVHCATFRRRERLFEGYDRLREWEKNHFNLC